MPEIPESISYIRIGENEHPIDAATLNGKEASEFQEGGKIVSSIDQNSTDEQIPSARCIYGMIYGSSYNPPTPHNYSQDYLTIVSISDNNTIGWKMDNYNATPKTISVSTDNGQTWTSKTSTSGGVTLATLNTGDRMLVRGNNNTYGSSYYNHFTSTNTFNVEGNIMSMLYGDDFVSQMTLPGTCTFYNLFVTSNIVNASNLILPATTLTDYCYSSMFFGCTSLTTAPELPATTLADGCYTQMFRQCTNLTTAPELPATTLADGCYSQMFRQCTNLTTAPALPATTLTYQCYYYMFTACNSLNQIECLATDISATNCTYRWVHTVAATGTFIKDPSMTGWTTGWSGVPEGWTVTDYQG